MNNRHSLPSVYWREVGLPRSIFVDRSWLAILGLLGSVNNDPDGHDMTYSTNSVLLTRTSLIQYSRLRSLFRPSSDCICVLHPKITAELFDLRLAASASPVTGDSAIDWLGTSRTQ